MNKRKRIQITVAFSSETMKAKIKAQYFSSADRKELSIHNTIPSKNTPLEMKGKSTHSQLKEN